MKLQNIYLLKLCTNFGECNNQFHAQLAYCTTKTMCKRKFYYFHITNTITLARIKSELSHIHLKVNVPIKISFVYDKTHTLYHTIGQMT